MNTRQLSPSPDYGLHEHVDWTVRHCCDCGDICMTASPEEGRCDTCKAEHDDEKRTAARLLVDAATRAILAHPERSLVRPRSGGMNDPRHIYCDGCGEVAVTFTGEPASLTPGEMFGECTCWGRLSIERDDEGHTVTRFIRLGCD